MKLRRVNASDPDAFDSWFAVFQRSELAREGRSGQGWHPDEWRARSVDLNAPKVWHLLVYGDESVGPTAVAAVEVTRDDNLHWLRGELHVEPSLRRRGHGAAALRQLENYSASLGRNQLAVGVIEGAREVGSAPNRTFAPLQGYRLADESVRREIEWPRPEGEIDRLEREWAQFATDYEIVSWTNQTPERWLADRARLSAVMPAEAPYADLDVDEEVWDEQRVRHHERETDAMGRELFVAAALHRASGLLVGYSELTVSREHTDNAYQWDTLVVRAHRGHRLGGLLKIATMRLLEASGLAVRTISTFNSSLNEPMIRVNDDLGARVGGAMVLWRKDLSS